MLLIGLLARLHLRRLDSIAYLIDLRPCEPLLFELIDDLAYLAPVDHAGIFDLDFYIGLAGESDDGQYDSGSESFRKRRSARTWPAFCRIGL